MKYFVGLALNRVAGMKGVTVLSATRVVASAPDDSRVYVQIDGEYAGHLPAEIKIVPDALTLLVRRICGQAGEACPKLTARRFRPGRAETAPPALGEHDHGAGEPSMVRRVSFIWIVRSILATSARSERLAKVVAHPRPGAAGAAHAVDEVLGRLRQVVIHDVRDAFDVDAARGDVGRDQHAVVPVLEALERLVALALAAVAVDARRL